jgi:phosphatidylglycerophosphatase A
MRWGGGEIIIILTLVFILFAWNAVFSRPDEDPEESRRLNKLAFLLWIAQGFGVGGIPFAPGTFGSLVGLLWFALLLAPGNIWFLAAGTIAGLWLSVWICGIAEKILKQTDPGSVVLDEITAMPVCFFGWVAIIMSRSGTLPGLEAFFSQRNLPLTLGVFVLFRFFDILKPWPVRQSQRLPGGWGVTVDDVLAAVYVNGVVVLVCGGGQMLHQ